MDNIFKFNDLCNNIIGIVFTSFCSGFISGLTFTPFLFTLIFQVVFIIGKRILGWGSILFLEILLALISLLGWIIGKLISIFMEDRIVKPGGLTEQEWADLKKNIWWVNPFKYL